MLTLTSVDIQYDLIASNISRITVDGIETEDGQHIDLDVIICATGEHASSTSPLATGSQ